MKKIISIFSFLISSSLAIPVLAAAPTDFKAVVNDVFINGLLKPVVPLLIGLAVVVFIYGVLTTVLSEGDKKEEGKQYMLWGIIGIFVMVSVWGLVAIVSGTFQLDNTRHSIQMTIPTVTVTPALKTGNK